MDPRFDPSLDPALARMSPDELRERERMARDADEAAAFRLRTLAGGGKFTQAGFDDPMEAVRAAAMLSRGETREASHAPAPPADDDLPPPPIVRSEYPPEIEAAIRARSTRRPRTGAAPSVAGPRNRALTISS